MNDHYLLIPSEQDWQRRQRQLAADAAKARRRRRFWIAVEFACWLSAYAIVIGGMVLTANVLKTYHNAALAAPQPERPVSP